MEKLCSVNNRGEFTFIIEGILPQEVPKVKHPPRELHPDYKNFLKQHIAEKVKLKKQLNDQQKIIDKKLLGIVYTYSYRKLFKYLTAILKLDSLLIRFSERNVCSFCIITGTFISPISTIAGDSLPKQSAKAVCAKVGLISFIWIYYYFFN